MHKRALVYPHARTNGANTVTKVTFYHDYKIINAFVTPLFIRSSQERIAMPLKHDLTLVKPTDTHIHSFFFVRDGIHSVADYNSTLMAVVVVVVVVVVVRIFTMG